jgi:membrane protease YdiL (CAAX protease family)
VRRVTRRRSLPVLLLTLVVAAWLTGRTFHAVPGSSRQTTLTYVLAAVLLAGAYVSGGSWPKAHRRGKHPVVGPLLTAVLLFCVFAVLSWASGWIGPIDRGVAAVVRHARAGSGWEIVLGATAAGVAEEVFYQGALFERVRLPILTATVLHMLTTLPAGNVALTLAAGLLGVVLGVSRRTSGGWWAPAVTHVAWALLVVAWLPV